MIIIIVIIKTIIQMKKINVLINQMMIAKNSLIEPTPTTNTDYNKIIKEINSFLLKYCDHVWIDDSIDISPDESKQIRYCRHCNITL